MQLAEDSWGPKSQTELFLHLNHSPAPPPGPAHLSLPLGSQVVPASAQAAPLASLIPREGGAEWRGSCVGTPQRVKVRPAGESSPAWLGAVGFSDVSYSPFNFLSCYRFITSGYQHV